MTLRRWVVGLLAAGVLVACAGGDDDSIPIGGRGGASGSGGSGDSTGTGGAGATGGTGATGGSGTTTGGSGATGGTSTATGGSSDGGSSDGGSSAGSGGDAETGGTPSQGGEPATGGNSTSGGEDGSGGSGMTCTDCASGACLASGECVECTADAHCSGDKPLCDTEQHVCVACLPSDDRCDEGSYCAEDLTCVPGCKNADSCASGVCGANHDCEQCVADSECAEGRVCSLGSCTDKCSDENECSSGSCCAEHCVDTTSNVNHCGGCDIACSEAQFCGVSGCTDTMLSNVCEQGKAVALLDGLSTDDPATRALLATLGGCSTPPTTREVSQDERDVINPDTGRLIAAGTELIVAAGGDFGQKLVNYFETAAIAPVFDTVSGDNLEFHLRDGGQAIVSVPAKSITDKHDYFVVELVRDPTTGAVALVTYGLGSPGTNAAVWYFANVMFADRENLTSDWYVYQWDDTDEVAGPSAGDEFVRKTAP